MPLGGVAMRLTDRGVAVAALTIIALAFLIAHYAPYVYLVRTR